MNSMQESICIQSRFEQDKPMNSIFKAIGQYEERYDSEQELGAPSQQQEKTYQGFQNKKSLKIKPLRMHKDIITLQKENADKKKIVKQLQSLNEQLKNQYDQCVSHNNQLEHFFKEVQFTFQPERKKIHASEVMVRAKKNLYQQAKEAKQRMKKMFKSSQTSAIQQLKIYIGILERQKQSLKEMVDQLSTKMDLRLKNEDFNIYQAKKFNEGCRNIRKILDNQVKNVSSHHEQYKIEKMQIKGKVKVRHLQAQKKKYKDECETVKQLLMEQEGLQYQISLLKHRAKDKKKEISQYDELLQRIKGKQTVTVRLEKQLKQKFKTYEYMLEWSRQLRKQLEARKSEHAKKKADFEDEINNLTSQYERYSQIYKAGLFEEQAAKRKGSKETILPHEVQKPILKKLVTFEQVRYQIKSLSFYLLQEKIDTDQFITELLKNVKKVLPAVKQVKKLRVKNMISLECFPTNEQITIEQICTNFQRLKIDLPSKQEITKLAQFVIQDRTTQQKLSINKKIARQIFKNILKRQLQTSEDFQSAQLGLKKLLRVHCDSIRPQLKLSGGFEEQIDLSIVKGSFRKYGLQPYEVNTLVEYVQYFGWRMSKTIGYIKLEDYDKMVNQLIKTEKFKNEFEEEDSQLN